jgi:O-antigen/teichoic acid export membrane protein
MALVWLDVLLVGYIISVRMAGIYGVANRYMVVVTFALAAAGGTIAPQVSRLLSLGRVGDVRHLYQAATGWVMAIGWPISLTLAAFAPLFMRLFGAEFRAGSTALTILALMMLYVTATGNNVVVLVMSGKTSTSLWVGVVTLGLNVGFNLYLIPRLGINGAALAWAVSLLASNAIIAVILFRRMQLHPFGPAFLHVAAASVLLIGLPSLLFRLLLGPHWLALCATAAIGLPTYLYCMWRLRERLELPALSTIFRP